MSATTFLVLDIETIPDAELYTPAQPAPGTERTFPPIYACKPVVIGVMWLDENLLCKKAGTIGEGKDEGAMLADFAEFMAKHEPTLVTWNGRGFDLPVLMMRSLRYGVSAPWYYRKTAYRYRYSTERHIDLCDVLADHGATRMTSLHGAARLIGLPGKEGVDGSQVEALYRTGQMEVLRGYCLSDVAQTAFLFLRYRLLAGLLDRAAYAGAANGLLATIAADARLATLAAHVDRARLLLE
ncbi:MAG: 3'-5' exonuclease [Deltaproteobacteria bacterium]|jgi:predicted PolB exonuclease-like 3'-5' exonuclease|nr:3'-5' exonuclease [Deltaproteobacteria bacterium]